mgnify:CR=1 FL=1
MILVNNLKARKLKDKIFKYVFFACIVFCLVFLAILVIGLLSKGLKYLNPKFLLSSPSLISAINAGFYPAIIGSFWILLLVGLVAVPIGVGSAIYLEQYLNKKSKWYHFLEVNISNLAGVPAIVYGLLGLTLFSRMHGLRGTILAGGITLSLMILPVIIVSSREAIKAVPKILIEAAYGLGMTKLQMIKAVILPYAAPGIFTGVILALSRAIGESAPILVVGAASMVTKLPKGILSRYTAMPIQIFQWSSYPKQEFQELAAAGIIVLLAFLLTANSIAIVLRNKYQKERG